MIINNASFGVAFTNSVVFTNNQVLFDPDVGYNTYLVRRFLFSVDNFEIVCDFCCILDIYGVKFSRKLLLINNSVIGNWMVIDAYEQVGQAIAMYNFTIIGHNSYGFFINNSVWLINNVVQGLNKTIKFTFNIRLFR